MIYIFGASGFAREIDAWLPCDSFVVEEGSGYVGMTIHGKKVITESELFISKSVGIGVVAIGDPQIRYKVVGKAYNFTFPYLTHPTCQFDKQRYHFDVGSIVCNGSIITTNVSIGRFTQVHTGCNIGHDVMIGEFTTVSPGVNISGKCLIGNKVFIGVGTSIIERIKIVNDVVIGAGAVVIKDIKEPGTYVGVPARRI